MQFKYVFYYLQVLLGIQSNFSCKIVNSSQIQNYKQLTNPWLNLHAHKLIRRCLSQEGFYSCLVNFNGYVFYKNLDDATIWYVEEISEDYYKVLNLFDNRRIILTK